MSYIQQYINHKSLRSRHLRILTTVFALLAATGSQDFLVNAQWRPADDYKKNILNYTFVNTTGIAGEKPTNSYKLSSMVDKEDPDSWEFITSDEEQTLKDNGININFPKFTFIDENTPKDENPYPLAPGQKRQRTHTVEHIVYALPGDPIALYPYYGLDEFHNFNDRFSHWYDFTTGGRVKYTDKSGKEYDLLDFPADRGDMQISEKFGFYGGIYMNPGTQTVDDGKWLMDNNANHVLRDDNLGKRQPGTSATFYFPNILSGEERLPMPEGRSEYVIAADFSQTFQLTTHLDVDLKEINEPIIATRHIFRIRDGREFAKEFAGSLEKNREYIRRHQKIVTARAGVDFQIRLEAPVAVGWGNAGGVTNYYYKGDDGSYHRVRGFKMKVLNGDTREWMHVDADENDRHDEEGFSFGANIWMKRSIAAGDHANADENYEYHSMLLKSNPEVGHYIVQLIAQVDNRNIKIKSEDGTQTGDLILMEYNITFLPEEGASLVTEETLYKDKKYEHARDAKLKEAYKEPIQKIDFDEYIKINKLTGHDNLKHKLISYSKYNVEGTDNPVYDGKSEYNDKKVGMQHSFFKWPVRWSLSNYSFGYNYRHDYNMYMLATHTENVPFHKAADDWDRNVEGDGNGLYDRLYYKTKRLNEEATTANLDEIPAVEQGYFYYVNAATDPGVSARLDFKIPCPGSRIVVSAWVAECSPIKNSGDETSNISFNFVAVMNGTGERIVLHNFITGYIPSGETGKWLNVYYSFVPRLSEFYSNTVTFDDVDHFELELAHNGKSSSGADYAIDDIRAYIVPPTADTDQKNKICKDEDLKLEISASFETLLEKIGVPESFGKDESEDVNIYYTFLDKDKFDEEYRKTPADNEGKKNATVAFNNSVINLNPLNSEEGLRTYSKITFQSNYNKITSYPEKPEEDPVLLQTPYRKKDKSGDRLIVFDEEFSQGIFIPGKEYYLVFRSSVNDNATADAAFFEVGGDCTYQCVMTVTPLNTIKIDGVIQKDYGKLIVCENQSPMIQINIFGKNEDTNDYKEIEKNAHFDWFYGTLEEFNSYAEENNPKHDLKQALSVFRKKNPDAESVAGIKPDEVKTDGEEMLEQWMLDIIEKASTPAEGSSVAKLQLYQASYVMPQMELDEEKETSGHVVAIPIDNSTIEGYVVCTAPIELEIKAGNKTPILRHGLTAITSYPEDMDDVPLRIGLDQVKDHSLIMPVRRVASSDDKTAASMKRVKETVKGSEVKREGCLFLVQTNDPEYKTLGTAVTENGEEKDVEDGMLWVGEITELQASTVIGAQNLFKAEFKDDFKFKEGYFYRMRFQFEEVPNEVSSTAEENEDQTVVCKGQDVFTLKIVPKYLLWTGDKNLNWNNDANWRRMEQAELYSTKKEGDHKHYVTDGVNDRKEAYAPLDFTNVVIDKSVEAPYLYGIDKTEVVDFYKPTVKQNWSENPTATPDNDSKKYADYPQKEEGTGQPTALVEFDMAAFYLDKETITNEDGSTTTVEKVGCRPWYANTCSDIHFKPGGTIMNQQELSYERAWVDVELDPSRWYTLAMPLKEVYAGDFYLPTKGARQVTELFQEINFDNSLAENNRFRPAVYQRGWDKSEARVYELENQSFDAPRNAAIKTFWSHVYNDVTEKYGSGVGFSVKTDVSDLTSEEWTDENGKVMFRFPKADTKYLYFNKAGDKTGHETTIIKSTETRNYKLNDAETGTITVTTASAGNYFLVGNPFMTYLDIQKFLTDTENADKVEGKFWIVTGTGQVAGNINDDGVTVADPETTEASVVSDPSAIAPMQGFFVKAKTAATELTLNYDKSMMRRYESSSSHNRLTAATRSGAAGETLRIVSENDGIPASAALLTENAYANNNNMVETLDNGDLGIRSTVYTVGNGKALSINSCEDAEGMEIGVIANPEEVTTLRFEGELATGEYSLYDKASGSLTSLYEGMEYEVTGPVSGRLFLTRSASLAEIDGGISWTASNGLLEVTDNAATGLLKVRVIDTLGRVIRETSTEGQQVSITLPTGIYVAEVVTATASKTVKLRL